MRSSNQTQIRRKAVEKEDYIREIMRQYEDKIITRLEFIEKLAYKNLPVYFFFIIEFYIFDLSIFGIALTIFD